MKKVLFPIAIIALGVATTFTSCKKEETEDPVITYGSLSGMAYANLDETNDTLPDGTPDTQYENVPSGTMVIAVVNPMDYTDNPDATVNYENVTYETTVGTDGSYTFNQIEAYTKEATVTIKFADFAHETTDYTVDINGDPVKSSTRHIYTKADETVTLVANDVRVVDVIYAY